MNENKERFSSYKTNDFSALSDTQKLRRQYLTNSRHQKLTGWRFAAFFGMFVGAIGAALYPIIVAPMNDSEKWNKISNENRKNMGVKQENIQPGNMKVWSDPFDRPSKS